jgi:hypothetical protein
MISQSLKHNAKMARMPFSILGIDHNVVIENHDKLVQFHHEYRVHQVHEVSGGISQFKRHNQIFIKTVSGRESHLQNIFFTNLDLIITRLKINLGEHLSTCQLIEQEVDAWQWVPVLDCHCIEWSTIDTRSQCLVLLLHKESGIAPRR